MNKQTLRPYRVRQTETEVTAIEWDMHRDPLSPEVLTQLFTHGATEEVNVGFDCVERIVLAPHSDKAIEYVSNKVTHYNHIMNQLISQSDRYAYKYMELQRENDVLNKHLNAYDSMFTDNITADRVITCVNALKGIENPEWFVNNAINYIIDNKAK